MATVNLYVQGNSAVDVADSNGYYRLQLNQMPADVDTLSLKGVYVTFDTAHNATGSDVIVMDVPDLNVLTVSNLNACINKIVIPTWGQAGLDNTILYWFEVPIMVKPSYLGYDRFSQLKVKFTNSDGTPCYVAKFGIWAYAKL